MFKYSTILTFQVRRELRYPQKHQSGQKYHNSTYESITGQKYNMTKVSQLDL